MTRSTPRTAVRTLIRLAIATGLVGLLAGLAGLVLVLIVHAIEHLAFGEGSGPFLDDLAQPAAWVPLATVTLAGVIAGVGWWALRRWGAPVASVEAGVEGATMPTVATSIDVLLQVTIVALGASIGKEVAPRELSAMLASHVVRWLRLDARWRRILIAAAAGGGLAAVYDVPLGGALFALEVLLVEFRPATAVPVLAASAIATLVARLAVPDAPLYRLPAVQVTPSLIGAALVLGPVLGVLATAFMSFTKVAGARRPTGWRLIVVMPLVFAAIGAVGMVLPEILGNGRALAQAGFLAAAPAALFILFAAVKFLATGATIGSGAVGGTLQPSVAFGAALGAAAAAGWAFIWPGASPSALAVVGAAAFLAGTMRAPFTAIALVVEFTGTGVTLIVPIFLAVAGALVAGSLAKRPGLAVFRPIDPGRE